MIRTHKITPCLWFDTQAEEAAKFYCSVFERSRIVSVARYGKAGVEHHGQPEGSVLTVLFELDGVQMTALNGGPHFQFTEAISLQVHCEAQEEIDRLWGRLIEGGAESQCGWLKDRFGLSWQIVPAKIAEWMTDPERERSERVMAALMPMKKIDLGTLERAYRGA